MSNISSELLLLGASLAAGASLGALYDLVWLLRLDMPKLLGRIWECAFLLCCAVWLFTLAMGPGSGRMRACSFSSARQVRKYTLCCCAPLCGRPCKRSGVLSKFRCPA